MGRGRTDLRDFETPIPARRRNGFGTRDDDDAPRAREEKQDDEDENDNGDPLVRDAAVDLNGHSDASIERSTCARGKARRRVIQDGWSG